MSKETIKLKCYDNVILEKEAHAAITPGHLISLNSDDEVLKHAVAGSSVIPVMVALENELEGEGIDTDYAAGDMVQVWIPGRGDVGYMWLADNCDIDIGDKLESAGDGTLREWTPLNSEAAGHEHSCIGIAIEAVDTTGSPAATTSRLKVLFL